MCKNYLWASLAGAIRLPTCQFDLLIYLHSSISPKRMKHTVTGHFKITYIVSIDSKNIFKGKLWKMEAVTSHHYHLTWTFSSSVHKMTCCLLNNLLEKINRKLSYSVKWMHVKTIQIIRPNNMLHSFGYHVCFKLTLLYTLKSACGFNTQFFFMTNSNSTRVGIQWHFCEEWNATLS